MDKQLVDTIQAIPGIRPFAGMDGAWEWSPIPLFKFTLALTSDGNRIVQVNARKVFDDDLIREVLTFARAEDLDAALRERYIALLPGFFTSDPHGYDSVGVLPPIANGYYRHRNAWLQKRTFAVFPAYASEVSGTESFDEACYRFSHMLHASDLHRDPVPCFKMRYDNKRTRARSTNAGRGFTTVDVLLRETELLAGSPDSFVELENFQGRVRTITWSGGNWIVLDSFGSWTGARDEVVAWARSFVVDGEPNLPGLRGEPEARGEGQAEEGYQPAEDRGREAAGYLRADRAAGEQADGQGNDGSPVDRGDDGEQDGRGDRGGADQHVLQGVGAGEAGVGRGQGQGEEQDAGPGPEVAVVRGQGHDSRSEEPLAAAGRVQGAQFWLQQQGERAGRDEERDDAGEDTGRGGQEQDGAGRSPGGGREAPPSHPGPAACQLGAGGQGRSGPAGDDGDRVGDGGGQGGDAGHEQGGVGDQGGDAARRSDDAGEDSRGEKD